MRRLVIVPRLVMCPIDSQLGGDSGERWIIVPGRRSAGWDCRCSINVTWSRGRN
jgi:hypothetical protein